MFTKQATLAAGIVLIIIAAAAITSANSGSATSSKESLSSPSPRDSSLAYKSDFNSGLNILRQANNCFAKAINQAKANDPSDYLVTIDLCKTEVNINDSFSSNLFDSLNRSSIAGTHLYNVWIGYSSTFESMSSISFPVSEYYLNYYIDRYNNAVDEINAAIKEFNTNDCLNCSASPSPTPTQQTGGNNLINCVGPDGKTLRLTQTDCDNFNAAWKQSPTPPPAVDPNLGAQAARGSFCTSAYGTLAQMMQYCLDDPQVDYQSCLNQSINAEEQCQSQ